MKALSQTGSFEEGRVQKFCTRLPLPCKDYTQSVKTLLSVLKSFLVSEKIKLIISSFESYVSLQFFIHKALSKGLITLKCLLLSEAEKHVNHKKVVSKERSFISGSVLLWRSFLSCWFHSSFLCHFQESCKKTCRFRYNKYLKLRMHYTSWTSLK